MLLRTIRLLFPTSVKERRAAALEAHLRGINRPSRSVLLSVDDRIKKFDYERPQRTAQELQKAQPDCFLIGKGLHEGVGIRDAAFRARREVILAARPRVERT